MERLSEADFLRLQLFGERIARLQVEVALAAREREAFAAGLAKRYNLVEGDSLNGETGVITRTEVKSDV